MTSVSRLTLALCVVVALHLLTRPVRAGDDAAKPVEVSSGDIQGSQVFLGNEASPFNFGVANASRGFQVNASLLFLQPSSGSLVYANITNPFPFLSPHWSEESVNPDFSPAFNVGIGYSFDCGGDLQLNWTHLNVDDNASVRVPNPYLGGTSGPASIQAVTPSFLMGPPPPFGSAAAVAHFDYDAINVEAGMLLCIGSHVQVRPFVGLQGARINSNLNTTFQSADGTITFNNVANSEFTGVGPRVGMDLHYVARRLDLFGEIAGSALMGTRQSGLDFITNSPTAAANGLVPNTQSFTSPDTTQVIPCIDGKLGVSYAIPVGKMGTLKCAMGYQAAVYINAINQYSLTEVENTLTMPYLGNTAVFVQSAVQNQSNFFVQGPILKLDLTF